MKFVSQFLPWLAGNLERYPQSQDLQAFIDCVQSCCNPDDAVFLKQADFIAGLHPSKLDGRYQERIVRRAWSIYNGLRTRGVTDVNYKVKNRCKLSGRTAGRPSGANVNDDMRKFFALRDLLGGNFTYHNYSKLSDKQKILLAKLPKRIL